MEGQTWKGKRKKVNGGRDLFLFWVVFSVCLSAITTVTGVLADEQGPDPVERALGLPGLKSRWDAITSWVKLKFIDFRSNLGENKSYGGSKKSSRPDVVVKEAATKSAETGKETVLKAAKSAAEVVDDAFYRAKEKVKKTLSFTKKSPPGDHEDL